MALSYIPKPYGIESKIKGKMEAEKYKARQQYALPKIKLGKATTYLKNQQHKLIRYLDDGRLNIGNNRAERAANDVLLAEKSRDLASSVL